MTMGDETQQVVSSIEHDLVPLCPLSPNRCIFRVPPHLREVNEEAYRPWFVSIGPFYYKDPRLEAMEEQKLRHLQNFLRRDNAHSLNNYVNYVRANQDSAREYYAQKLSLSCEDFVRMLLLDAVFIIEYFLDFTTGNRVDVLEQKIEVSREAWRDLLLEENQVPFFILKGLYDLAFGTGMNNNSDNLSFVDLTFLFIFDCYYPERESEPTTARENIMKATNIWHLVDFARICLLPSTLQEQLAAAGSSSNIIPRIEFPLSASELSAAGVKFVASESKNLLDISFDKGFLEIPKLRVEDITASTFRSIMLLEQYHPCLVCYFTDYVTFLDCLINTPKDVEILVQNGIIKNWLGSNKEVTDLFNKITKHTGPDESYFYYNKVSRDLNEYANTPWHRWKAILKSNYFNHPWSTISVIYAVVLLILTILQTITSFNSKC